MLDLSYIFVTCYLLHTFVIYINLHTEMWRLNRRLRCKERGDAKKINNTLHLYILHIIDELITYLLPTCRLFILIIYLDSQEIEAERV